MLPHPHQQQLVESLSKLPTGGLLQAQPPVDRCSVCTGLSPSQRKQSQLFEAARLQLLPCPDSDIGAPTKTPTLAF